MANKTGGQTRIGNPNKFGAGVKGSGGPMGIHPSRADGYGDMKKTDTQTPITNSKGSMSRGGSPYVSGAHARGGKRG